MITVSVYSEKNDDKIELIDFKIVDLSNDVLSSKLEIELLEEAVCNVDTYGLRSGEYYLLDFERIYENDGSGAKNDLTFYLIELRLQSLDKDVKLIEKFIDWARDCGEDVFYVFDNTEEAIDKFITKNN